jgi:outer membrane murein-binding lipoprotein Lpp
MQALSDGQHIAAIEAKVDKLETKIDDGFAQMRTEFKNVRTEMREEVTAARTEARADFRLLIGILLPMYLTIILGFAALLLQHHV